MIACITGAKARRCVAICVAASLFSLADAMLGLQSQAESSHEPPSAASDSVAAKENTPTTLSDSTAANHPTNIIDTVVIIPRLDFPSTRLADALTALARAYNLSLYVDSSVTGTITLRLDNISLNDALMLIIKEHELDWERTGDIIKIFRPVPPPAELEPLDIGYEDGKISADLNNAQLSQFVNSLIDLTARNIIVEDNIRGTVTGRVSHLDFETALEVLLDANGFTFRKVGEVLIVGLAATEGQTGRRPRNMNVRCDDGLVSVDISDGALSDAVFLVVRQCGVSLLLQTKLEGSITASFEGRSVDKALTSLLMNSPYSFKFADGIFYVGNRESEDLFDTELVKLNHLIAAVVEPLIPVSLSKQVTVKVVKEHNGLLITGPITSIARIEQFLDKVDIPTAQVLFEVLVVDYSSTERAEFSLTANNFGGDSAQPGETYFPSLDLNAIGDDVNRSLRSLERRLSISNLGTVGQDFFMRLRMLQQEGKATIRSHPQIAALNGHTASLRIGTSQYYLLESKTIYPTEQSNISTQTTQRFEIIEADMSLEVTPYVSPNGELTVEVKPEFNTPATTFDPDIPPTINKRVFESTVRLRSGETIVLGGLVQTTETKQIEKLPILGSLPLIGRLFQNRSSSETRSELMVYITPHVYFGSDGSVNIDSVLSLR